MTNTTRSATSTTWSIGKWQRAPGERQNLRWIGGVLAIAAVYFASAKLGLSLAFVAEQISPVWPPTGVAIAAILLIGYRVWPGIAVGAFLANVTSHEPYATACGIAIGNTLEAVIAAWLLKRVVEFDNSLGRIRDAIGFIVLAAGLSTMVSATIGVTSLRLGNVYLPSLQRTIDWSDFWSLWWVWWLGDAMGALVVAPPLLVWATDRGLPRPRVEAVALFTGLIATSGLVFLGGFTTGFGGSSLEYVVFPFVIWAALRFGQTMTTAVILVASSVTIWATLHNLGPFGTGTVHERLLLLQAYMGVMAVSALLLGAALTERKQATLALRDADRRKDEFLATLAHELRNPLSPIRAGVDLLRVMKPIDLEVQEVLEMLDRQVQQTTRLVDDLLDVSRVTRGKIRLQLQTIDLSTVVKQAIETCRPLIDAKCQKLAISLPLESLLVVGDQIRLAQVFANLLNNASKYTDAGGRITLTVTQERNELVARVCDTGFGIEPELLPRVFDFFVQGDRSLTRSEGGLGIGLTLVLQLVQLHGGSVQAFSEGGGKGSEFVVRLPLAAEAPAADKVKSPKVIGSSRISGAPRHILVVDDNADAARSLALLLKTAGHKVRIAHTGSIALEMAVTDQPDIVLLDIGLPDMDGYEVARLIRKQPWSKGIVLVAVTGWGQPEDRQRAIDAGLNHHLTKPVEYTALTELIGSVAARACAVDHAN